jgi:predicted DCC family thiol-disulfide oxidoreductase YuxK
LGSFNIINGFIYTIGWAICVISGASGYRVIPMVVTFFLVIGQLLYICYKNKILFEQNLFILIYTAILGFFMEIAFLGLSLLKYSTINELFYLFPPGWIFCLYFLFSLTFNHSLLFLNRKWKFACIGGLVGGLLSYYAGYRIGAVSFSTKYSIYIIALFWSFFLTLIIELNKKLMEIAGLVYNPLYIQKTLKVFFDGGCPICSRELIHLKKRKQTGTVEYISFSCSGELEKYTDLFDFQSAMSQIHALDSSGKVLKGVEAFSELYSRVDLQWLAFLLKAPIFNQVFKLGYFFWTKYRLFIRKPSR